MQEHIDNLFIGGSVHLDRVIRRRAMQCILSGKQPLQIDFLSEKRRLSEYQNFLHATNPEEANGAISNIKTFDGDWTKWLESSKMKANVCRTF